jgi:ribonuclease-3
MTPEAFAQRNKLRFKRPELLIEALTHRSYVNEHDEPGVSDNERLEFLGDAVLGFVAGEWLFTRFPDLPEGELTRLRAALVQRDALAALARESELGAALRIGKGEEANGGRERDNNLCDAFEAVVGAVLVDQGLNAVRKFIMPRFEQQLALVLAAQNDKDARSVLQEWSQARYGMTPQYHVIDATGPDHERQYTIEARIGDRVVGRGTGRSKQTASQAAARDALPIIERDSPMEG